MVQFRLHCALAGVLEAPPLPTHVFKQNIAALSHVIVQVAFADCCGSKITGGGGGAVWSDCPRAAGAQSVLNRTLNCRICLIEPLPPQVQLASFYKLCPKSSTLEQLMPRGDRALTSPAAMAARSVRLARRVMVSPRVEF